TPLRSSLTPDMRLHRAVGMCRTFDMEKFRSTSLWVAFSTTLPFPTASVVRFVPKPCTVNGRS
ncbi:hypothetical protein C8F04DRAFT_908839, partial [Mycena alexandri]